MSARLKPYFPEILFRLYAGGDKPVPGSSVDIEGTFLFADISGFTAMSELLAASGKEGAEELTGIMNGFFTSFCAVLAGYGGDILFFGGDAAMVFFRKNEGETWRENCVRGFVCSLALHENVMQMGAVKTSSGCFSLSMTIGFSSGAGKAVFAGVNAPSSIIFAGRVLRNCCKAESLASPGGTACHFSFGRHFDGSMMKRRSRGFYVPVIINPPSVRCADVLDIKAAKIASGCAAFLDERLRRRVRASKTPFYGEHRTVTTSFINFEDLDYDNDVNAPLRLNLYYVFLCDVVNRYGGFVSRIDTADKGSKALVLFGAPVAFEYIEERALLCAKELLETNAVGLKQKIGITTGNVYAGDVGSSVRKEYTLMGDAVNLAARLMSRSKWGEILIDERTGAKAGRRFSFSKREPVIVKGKKDKITILQISGLKEEGALGEEEKTVAITGRRKELNLIRKFKKLTSEGVSSILTISGPQGTGKTVILNKLSSCLEGSEVKKFYLTPDPVIKGVALKPWLSFFRAAFGFEKNDSVSLRSRKTRARIKGLKGDWHLLAPLMGEALSLDIPHNYLTSSMGPELKMERLFDLALELLINESLKHKCLIIFDDIQWIDGTSLKLLNYILRNIPSGNISIVLSGREEIVINDIPESAERFSIRLRNFNEKESEKLALKVLKGKVPAKFLKNLVMRSEGNPLFITEASEAFNRTRSEEIPESMNGIVMTKIDSIDESMRAVLKTASVAGQYFTEDILNDLMNASGKLPAILGRLVSEGIVSSSGGGNYCFSRLMFREVAYETLLFRDRRELHLKAGDLICDKHKNNLNEVYEILAHHYYSAHAAPKAVEYLYKAGKKTASLYANDEALDFLSKGIEMAESDLLNFRSELIDMLIEKGSIYQIKGDANQSQAVYMKAFNFCGQDQYYKKTLLLNKQGHSYRIKGDLSEAKKLHYRALRFKKLDNSEKTAACCQAYEGLASCYGDEGKLIKSKKYFLRSLELRKCSMKFSSELGTLLINLGLVEKYLGHYHKAEELFKEAETIFVKDNDQLRLAHCLKLLGSIQSFRGDISGAEESMKKALDSFRKVGYSKGLISTLSYLGWLSLRTSRYEDALRYQQESLDLSRKAGLMPGVLYGLNNAGEVFRCLNLMDRAVDCHEKALKLADELGIKSEKADILRNLGEDFVRTGQLEKSQKHITAALKLAEELGVKEYEINALIALAGIDEKNGNSADAEKRIDRAFDIALKTDNKFLIISVYYSWLSLAAADKGADHRLLDFDSAAAMAEELKNHELLWKIHCLKIKIEKINSGSLNRKVLKHFNMFRGLFRSDESRENCLSSPLYSDFIAITKRAMGL